MIPRNDYIDIKVRCPRKVDFVVKIRMRAYPCENAQTRYTTRGCEHSCGKSLCLKCMSALSEAFNNGFYPETGQIITPDLSMSKIQ